MVAGHIARGARARWRRASAAARSAAPRSPPSHSPPRRLPPPRRDHPPAAAKERGGGAGGAAVVVGRAEEGTVAPWLVGGAAACPRSGESKPWRALARARALCALALALVARRRAAYSRRAPPLVASGGRVALAPDEAASVLSALPPKSSTRCDGSAPSCSVAGSHASVYKAVGHCRSSTTRRVRLASSHAIGCAAPSPSSAARSAAALAHGRSCRSTVPCHLGSVSTCR